MYPLDVSLRTKIGGSFEPLERYFRTLCHPNDPLSDSILAAAPPTELLHSETPLFVHCSRNVALQPNEEIHSNTSGWWMLVGIGGFICGLVVCEDEKVTTAVVMPLLGARALGVGLTLRMEMKATVIEQEVTLSLINVPHRIYSVLVYTYYTVRV
ncbi:hypothetical protein KQX54_016205 [Cotesia glomerata]|uniref:Uncharacterized protein n=1 Tax=Cotesia glomerata TaxID=32391 RepID=A0AAV7HF30_COTGL|nr:hypothetical protein KQX54_016205 [Cotesia glomerata]